MSDTMEIARQGPRTRGPRPGRTPMPLLSAIAASALTACFYDPTGSEPTTEIPAETTSDVDPGICGDGVVEGPEQCDDADQNNANSCTNACTLARCGDGILGPGEACDDNNTRSGDDCSELCALESCGDGIVGPAEQCDDGSDDDDECTSLCRPPACGDGLVTPSAGEECDVGPDDGVDGCFGCQQVECGDGMVEGDEACDDGNASDTDACTNLCEPARCGDGFLQPGEQCDDANDVDNDDCTNDCVTSVCGDAIVQPGEQCDDGPDNQDDMACKSDCQQNICGDGHVLVGTEACDDGNVDNSDLCLDTCELSPCFELDPNTCPGSIEVELTEAHVDLAIDDLGDQWDNKYNGTIASMLCVPLEVPDSAFPFVYGMTLTIGMDHAYAGDVTIKIVSPDAQILTPLHRPGVADLPDDGSSCCGDSSNFSSGFRFSFSNAATLSAKEMGNPLASLQIICKDEAPKIDPCTFKPYPGLAPGKDFDDFKGKPAVGTWQACIGDSQAQDFGKLTYAGLLISRAKYPPK